MTTLEAFSVHFVIEFSISVFSNPRVLLECQKQLLL